MKYLKPVIIKRLHDKATVVLAAGLEAQARADAQHASRYRVKEETYPELDHAWAGLLAVMDDFKNEDESITLVAKYIHKFDEAVRIYQMSLKEPSQELIERAKTECAKISQVIDLLEQSSGDTISSTELKDLGAFKWVRVV